MMESPIIQLEEPPPVRPPGRLPTGCVILLWFAALSILFLVVTWNGLGPVPRALKTQAASMIRTLLNAVSQYETDQNHLPMPVSGTIGQDWTTDSSAAEGVVSALKGSDPVLKSAAIDYIGEVRDAKWVDGTPTDGLQREKPGFALYDPWGHYYHIRMDGDGDGSVADPENPAEQLKKRIIIWSAGKDGNPDTWRDNICSWKE